MSPPDARQVYEVREEQLQALATAAAREGARQALAAVGLEDEKAIDDVRDLRSLLKAWRETKKTAWRTTVGFTTKAILVLLLLGLAVKLKLSLLYG